MDWLDRTKADKEDEQTGKCALHADEEARLPASCTDSSDVLLVKRIYSTDIQELERS